jgi:hypothetical protein
VGDSIPKTNALKKKIPQSLNCGGLAFLKTYFDPALKTLTMRNRLVITYDNYGKIDLLTFYQK